jgi:hypothetical protein
MLTRSQTSMPKRTRTDGSAPVAKRTRASSPAPVAKRTRSQATQMIQANEEFTAKGGARSRSQANEEFTQARLGVRSHLPANEEFSPQFFDEASAAWRENKKLGPNMTFKYICQGTSKKGTPCKKLAALDTDQFMCAGHYISTEPPQTLRRSSRLAN